MESVDPLVALLAVATVVLVVVAALVGPALLGRGPLYRRLLAVEPRPHAGERKAPADASPVAGIAILPSVRLLGREHRPEGRNDALARRGVRPPEDSLDEMLQGAFSADSFNRGIRILAWSFILVVVVIVSVSQLWLSAQPQIFGTLGLAGVFVLVVHELMPPGGLGTLRVVVEASAAIVMLTMLVMLTGGAMSPFFFIYPLLVGGAALIASPRATLLLTVETAAAYFVASFSAPLGVDAARESMARVAISLTVLALLSYTGMVISRVQRRTREAAIRLSTVDSLTDLRNRAFFFNAVDREVLRSRRFRRGFCLLMMDLDGLKAINDRYGHYQGDLVLRAVAHVIRSGLRGVDVAARYGGDEFVALLPETDPSGAYLVAEKIRQTASEMVVGARGLEIKTSLSIGVVSYPDDGRTADELLIAADQAMYSSKRHGKNRVVGYAHPDDLTAPFPAPQYPMPVPAPGFLADRDDRERDERERGELERGELDSI